MKNERKAIIHIFLMMAVCLAANVILARLMVLLEWPLFMDSIGTIIAAALGGYFPGIAVGFFTNIIVGVQDPITLYYGIINILIGIAAAYGSRRKYFLDVSKAFVAALALAVIGGGLGSLLTWFLYGQNIGSGISAPLSNYIFENSTYFSEFWAQFIADMLIDIADKIVSVGLVFAALKLLPKAFISQFPLGYVYGADPDRAKEKAEANRQGRHSLRVEIVGIILLASIVVGLLATGISFYMYHDYMYDHIYEDYTAVIQNAAEKVNANLEDGWPDENDGDAGASIETCLSTIKGNNANILSLCLYQETYGEAVAILEIGEVISEKDGSGKIIAQADDEAPVDIFMAGAVLTLKTPVYDAAQETVGYIVLQVSLESFRTDELIYIIRIMSLVFAATILIAALAIWFSQWRLIHPINAIRDAASSFAYGIQGDREKSTEKIRGLSIHSGNEIEELYKAMLKTVDDVADYIGLISRLQESVVLGFAQMVESRDRNTGSHIQKTSRYVNLIAVSMKRQGAYQDQLSDEFIEKITKSAPLHDVGKIKVSDAILNKPGKLTPQEAEIMKNHASEGCGILMGVAHNSGDTGYLDDAADMAAYHHEHWDGSGHPFGLSGEQIPLSARIMAVADVFDALISKRSYKEAFPLEKAKRIIMEGSGTQFDPKVVDAFLAVFDEMKDNETS